MFLTEQMDASSISKFKGIYEVPTFIRLYAMQKKLVDFPKKTVSNCLFVFNGGVPVGMVPEPLTLQLFVNDQKKKPWVRYWALKPIILCFQQSHKSLPRNYGELFEVEVAAPTLPDTLRWGPINYGTVTSKKMQTKWNLSLWSWFYMSICLERSWGSWANLAIYLANFTTLVGWCLVRGL